MNATRYPASAFRIALIVLATSFGASLVQGASPDPTQPKAHSDSLGAAVDDAAITAQIKTRMMGDKNFAHSDINVTTTNGVVTLEGSASSSNAKSAAGAAAKAIAGVKSVDNNLKVPASSKAAATTNEAVAKAQRVGSDSWITTKVKSEILADSVTKGFEVHVTTTHGVVVLKGALGSQDAITHVKNIAAKVEGVKSVNTSALKVVAG